MTTDIRLGFSSYSFHPKLASGEMTLSDVIDWVAASEGEHLELASLSDDPASPVPNIAWSEEAIGAIRTKAQDAGVVLSTLAIPADLSSADPAEHSRQVQRIKDYVDLAGKLGITQMRHDVVAHAGVDGDDTPLFEEVLPRIVAGAKEIAQYAGPLGVTTSLENHGFFVQSSDRVRRIVLAVDEPTFRTTLDVGNFVCVDEDPVPAVTQNLPYAMVVHLKDFYIRPAQNDPGEGWFPSRGGKHLRGAVLGNGDLDLQAICRIIRDSEYSGFVSLEFEGWEDSLLGCSRGLAAARRLLA